MRVRIGTGRWRPLTGAAALATAIVLLAPAAAQAHGAVNPAASSFEARLDRPPAGLAAKIVDGDLRIWLQVPARETVTVLDYRGAPYLRFTPAGVRVNTNSAMYYLNLVPAVSPPPNLGPGAEPSWTAAGSGHAYEWHDGRLHALAATAIAPGTRYVGRWSIPILIDGRRTALTGGLYHAPAPPIVWFWPIAVVLTCLAAALRLRRPQLELRCARAAGLLALVAFTALVLGRQLHGRPGVNAWQLSELAVELAFVGWALRWLLTGGSVWLGLFAVGAAAIWEGATLVGVLLHGFVLLAVPAPVARAADTTALACGLALVVISVRMALAHSDSEEDEEPEWDETDLAWEP